ncbi:hypothetical protein AB2L57_08195 [Microbacterium sp. HA-8]|uniref:hypothetical protein n=1 Tax=Microbacterium sp. HA-8 TaxID=3234200 RepID=UPI0038F6B213
MAQFPKQFINLIGAILVIAVIVAGILLLAVPLFVNASQTGESAQSVAASNAAYAVRVATLEAESERLDEIESDLAELRAEIPAASDLDDVFELVATAAQQAGVTVVSATASTSEPWAARTAAVSTDAAVAPDAPADAQAPADGTTDAAASGTETSETAGGAASTDSGRVQVPFTIIVEAADPDAAARFLDALAQGPRLIAVVQSSLVDDAESPRLTVNALTFVQPGAASAAGE